MRIENSLTISAPVAVVWAVTLDMDGLPELTPTTITQVDRLDDAPLAVGHRVRITQPGLGAKVWTVSELVPERRFEWWTKVGTVRMTARHELAAAGNGTRNQLSITFSGFGAGLLGRISKKKVESTLATENAGFARVSAARLDASPA